ncbi:hypothetical protein OG241_11890 [Streptomyces sp. NBC_01390]|uniref:hypothetical protein n=1 Tax=Streptomyces sp. NBC_01390 TaxID=2903850 RepID=UPI0032537169
MSGSLLDASAVIGCPHGGRVSAASTPTGGVRVAGAVVVTAAHANTVVTGCPHTVDGVPTPCVSVRWTAADTGVLVDGAPALLDTSAAQCFTSGLVPQGPPVVQAVQRKVTVR